MKEAMYWKKADGGKVRCGLCNHGCVVAEGKRGICGVRVNREGKLYSMVYGKPSSACLDPIEKKPLYNFHPGSEVFSYGTLGCNFRCAFCQNYSISQTHPKDDGSLGAGLRNTEITPAQAVQAALDSGGHGIAWTYNEPTIWYEFNLEASKMAKKKGLYTVYVTNGYIAPEPLKELAPYMDAMNIDVKAFTDEFYKKTCGARLEPVLRTCETAMKLGIHVELTTLLIPGENDSKEELDKLTKWVHDGCGANTPLHFSRYHPDYKYEKPATSEKSLLQAYKIAKNAGLEHVYVGNVYHADYMDTYCPKCNARVIERTSMFFSSNRLKDGKCAQCGYQVLKHF